MYDQASINIDHLCRKNSATVVDGTDCMTAASNCHMYHGMPGGVIKDSLDIDSANDSDNISTGTRNSRTASTSLTSFGVSPTRTEQEQTKAGGIADVCSLHFESTMHDNFLLFIEPNPVLPPSYEDLPPGGCPRYPVIETLSGNEELPQYTPAACKLGIFQRKQECVSPYDLSSNRSWKTVVIELNSTQLNIYAVSAQLEKVLWNINSSFVEELDSNIGKVTPKSAFSSLITNSRDMKLRAFCERSGLLNAEFAESRRIAATKSFSNALGLHSKSHSTLQKSSKHQLIRSYSLQHAKFGLANDYTKKPNVLRLRLENEQFLVQFSSAKELIEWHLAMSIGKDVALDLNEREAPKYRTVPRRRRNTLFSTTMNLNDAMAGRLRSQSDPHPKQRSPKSHTGFGGLMFKSFTSGSLVSDQTNFTSKPFHIPRNLAPDIRRVQKVPNPINHVENMKLKRTPGLSVGKGKTNQSSGFTEANGGQSESNLSSSKDFTPDGPTTLSRTSDEFQQSEEEYEDEDELEADSDADDMDVGNTQISTCSDLIKSSTRRIDDDKWNPMYKLESERRFLRNCLKCIRPLGFNDKWQNKLIVKPINITPLISRYVTSPSTVHNLEHNAWGNFSKTRLINTKVYWLSASSKQDTSSNLEELQMTGMALNRTPHHSLQEYVVGSHALIPKSS
ncbi:hypothetical protein METBIDRAFT_10141 [Metschnikowia bicuspidata var. bicuspidata NRRL YB-4993]|uniref:PH domain-containing protein n=1 Tax=Metschnikowia bicuspidata var. bicuspidata NRRL YB-4993 TaxID=869754 RepID=A0A1A0HJ74_9ASCO|nr:hypothetical protein METBIDRAFT_10141 [Metschnikowia bicuspidata var. bicuspidata NRRL YB-4993]OBA23937.1 hypothetical protein METBIDRAFT_10141 [Metschnikowia bicuspidata var. bicuspidata NRRL YB-4993]